MPNDNLGSKNRFRRRGICGATRRRYATCSIPLLRYTTGGIGLCGAMPEVRTGS